MDLTAKIEALEEEVNLLKGEIKAILQEVRVAILTRENPVAVDGGVEVSRPASSPPGQIAALPAHQSTDFDMPAQPYSPPVVQQIQPAPVSQLGTFALPTLATEEDSDAEAVAYQGPERRASNRP